MKPKKSKQVRPKSKIAESLANAVEWFTQRFSPWCDGCYFDDKNSYSKRASDEPTGWNAPVGFTMVREHTCKGKRNKPVYVEDTGEVVNLFEYRKDHSDRSGTNRRSKR